MAEKKKKSDPALSYTPDAQRRDRQATKDYYGNQLRKQNEIERKTPGYFPLDVLNLGPTDKNGDLAIDRESRKTRKMALDLPGKVADQNRWIARGAKANAIAIAKVKAKKSKASGGWEEMTGMTRAEKIAQMRKAGVSEAAIKAALGE